MPYTLTIGTLFSAPIRLHVSLLILPLWYIAMAVPGGHGFWEVVEGMSLIVAACVAIVVHECGHILVARRAGISCGGILILPIGAISKLDSRASSPRIEAAIAVAGPLVSLALAMAFYFLAYLGGDTLAFDVPALARASFAQKMGVVNLGIAVFNLVPILPLDGGKIVQALLTPFFGKVRATRWLAYVGFASAAVMFVAGYRVDLFFFFIAGLAIWAGLREIGAAEAEGLFRHLASGDALTGDFEWLSEDQEILPMMDELLASSQREFPVMRDGQLVGFLNRADLAKGIAGGRTNRQVGEVMRPVEVITHSQEPLALALEKMRQNRTGILPVIDDGSFIGVLKLREAAVAELFQQAQNEAVLRANE